MAIDAMIDRFRDTGCAYAIDGKQGGRILSPLQQVDYRNFATNPQDWGTSWASSIGANEGWEVDITARYYTATGTTVILGRGTGNFLLQPGTTGVLCAFYCVKLGSSPVWTVEPDFVGQVLTSIGTVSANLAIKKEIFPVGEFHALKLVRGDSFVSVYFDGKLVATCTGTLIDNKPFNSLTSDGNIQSITLKNSAGTTVWQAPQNELYSGWLLNTLATQPSQNTFERRNGLLSYVGSVITSANGVFSAVNPATASLLTLPLQLGGYTGSLTMLWKGNVQEDAFGSLFFTNPTTGISLNRLGIQINDGTTTVNAQEAVNPIYGEQIRVGVVDRENKLLTLYVNGNVIKSLAIPDTFGALNSAGTITYAGCSGELEALAFWPRALSAEEVAIL